MGRLFMISGPFSLTLKLSEQKQWSSPQKNVVSCIWLFHLSSSGCLKLKEEIDHGVVLTSTGLLRVRPSSEGI